ncbi:MAG: hypothetical protein RR334_02060, partial [Clostridia bacterium]
HEFSYDEYGYVHNASQSRLDELDKMQKKFIKEIDYNSYSENDILTEDIGWEVSKKINKFKSINLGIYSTQLYKNRIELVSSKKTIIIQLSTIAGYAIEGQNGIQLWLENQEVYRLKNSKPISGLKYVNMISALTNKIMKF